MRASELQTSRIPLLARLAALFAGCVTAGMLFAPSGVVVSLERRSGVNAVSTPWRVAALPAGGAEGCRGGDVDPAINEPSAYQVRLKEEVQQLLAQGGCPGWMALASETDIVSAGQRDAAVMQDEEVTPTAGAEVIAPVVRYPKPVGVETSAGPVLRLVQLPPVGDELISEQEDLLHTSPEIQGAKEQPATPPPNAPAAKPATEPGASPNQSAEPKPTAAPAVAAPVERKPAAAVPPAEDLLKGVDDLLTPEVPPTGPSSPPATLPQRKTPNPAADLLDDRDDLLAPKATPRAVPPAATLPPATTPQVVAPPATLPSPFVPPPAGMPPMHGAPSGAAAGPSGGQANGATSGAAGGVGSTAGAAAAKTADKRPPGEQSRCTFVAESLYPSAKTCRVCHEKIYEEWSISSHAYAAMSPMFHKFEQKINDLTQGTIGYFCYRCHSPVGTTLGISRAAPMYDLPPVAREGVTCIACHRIREWYGKTNGERRIEPGDVYAPMYGPFGGDGVAQVVDEKANFKVKTSPDETGPGQPMHAAAFSFPQLSHASFCTSCHQVAVYPGIKLEVVWEQYRASPACKKGISCQDCHMGRIPGVPSGYEYGAAAEINKKTVNNDRKHSNHIFYGPGYSIAHPGVFPFNPKADRWSMKDWLLFDWRAGWGTDEFEDAVEDGAVVVQFPEAWKESDDRYDARDVIEENLKKKRLKNELRAQVMENGSRINGPFFTKPRVRGQDLEFNYIVTNTNEGHNLPTGSLGAQPQLWANVALINPRGQRVWESGYLDRFGDLADIHSEDVRHKRIAYDWQLFNLQTMFLITGVKGTDREFFLPINIDVDPLPFIRPAAQPISVLNHPPFIRMEARSLAPCGSRTVPYKVPGELLCEPGRYRLSFRMRNRTEPMYFMRFCDSTVEMERAMMEGTLDFHQSSVEFDVE
ncbi:multiheme c-type cytochrome [Lacipirellula limnantheis]|uniref:Cytochrome c-552/4 domain-containing protein n=1 Tax=Lacipirellula limnantheis TaxID=2528024 RepID=A0A517U3Q8_9BACT|nr:multiheme c-type cytochrome [Lacipirellula limnantheis]QDT75258.1 hypothetical protein I41_44680 [Lacipirellula limnantheis]